MELAVVAERAARVMSGEEARGVDEVDVKDLVVTQVGGVGGGCCSCLAGVDCSGELADRVGHRPASWKVENHWKVSPLLRRQPRPVLLPDAVPTVPELRRRPCASPSVGRG